MGRFLRPETPLNSPCKLASYVLSWSLTLPIWVRQSRLLRLIPSSTYPRHRIPAFLLMVIKLVYICARQRSSAPPARSSGSANRIDAAGGTAVAAALTALTALTFLGLRCYIYIYAYCIFLISANQRMISVNAFAGHRVLCHDRAGERYHASVCAPSNKVVPPSALPNCKPPLTLFRAHQTFLSSTYLKGAKFS